MNYIVLFEFLLELSEFLKSSINVKKSLFKSFFEKRKQLCSDFHFSIFLDDTEVNARLDLQNHFVAFFVLFGSVWVVCFAFVKDS